MLRVVLWFVVWCCLALSLCCGGARVVVLCCVVLCCFVCCCVAFGSVLCLGTQIFALSCGVVWLLVVFWCFVFVG